MPAARTVRKAAYSALADDLRDAIERREYPSGARLPTELELAAEYGLSRQTVRRAYLELVVDGLVERVAGRGTFVSADAHRYVHRFRSVQDLMSFPETSMTIMRGFSGAVDAEAATRLGLDGDVVMSIEYIRSHRDVPFAWTTVHLPPDVAVLVEGSPVLAVGGHAQPVTVIALLESRMAEPITVAEQAVSAVAADARVADRLGCAPGSPILRIDRVFMTESGRAVETSIGYFLPELYTYRASLLREPSSSRGAMRPPADEGDVLG